MNNTFLSWDFFRERRFFVPLERCWGGHITREEYGVTIFTVVTNFDIIVLEVHKLQKTIRV